MHFDRFKITVSTNPYFLLKNVHIFPINLSKNKTKNAFLLRIRRSNRKSIVGQRMYILQQQKNEDRAEYSSERSRIRVCVLVFFFLVGRELSRVPREFINRFNWTKLERIKQIRNISKEMKTLKSFTVILRPNRNARAHWRQSNFIKWGHRCVSIFYTHLLYICIGFICLKFLWFFFSCFFYLFVLWKSFSRIYILFEKTK